MPLVPSRRSPRWGNKLVKAGDKDGEQVGVIEQWCEVSRRLPDPSNRSASCSSGSQGYVNPEPERTVDGSCDDRHDGPLGGLHHSRWHRSTAENRRRLCYREIPRNPPSKLRIFLAPCANGLIVGLRTWDRPEVACRPKRLMSPATCHD